MLKEKEKMRKRCRVLGRIPEVLKVLLLCILLVIMSIGNSKIIQLTIIVGIILIIIVGILLVISDILQAQYFRWLNNKDIDIVDEVVFYAIDDKAIVKSIKIKNGLIAIKYVTTGEKWKTSAIYLDISDAHWYMYIG